MNARRLNPDQKRFFSTVTQAAFSNPFSGERTRLDSELSGKSGSPQRQRLEGIQNVLREVELLEKNGEGHIDFFHPADHGAIRLAFLFDVFHRFLDEFDTLIQAQSSSVEQSIPVPFASRALKLLERRGFNNKEALRYFAFFYQLRRAFYFIDHFVTGLSPCMQLLREDLWRNLFTHRLDLFEDILHDRMEDFSTLILGATGSGKGTAARAIGQSGFIPFDPDKGCFASCFTGTFVAVNLSQFSESLIESELFGHQKGAFTGAIDRHAGVFERCSAYGAIFLDEIGDVSVPLQIKLLKVLEERVFHPVGSHESRRFSGRIIAATHQSLTELRHEGSFRNDFYYRLCTDTITVPTLRRRLDEESGELVFLVTRIIKRISDRNLPDVAKEVAATIDKAMPAHYSWPGNVRELEQNVRRILLNGTCAADPLVLTPLIGQNDFQVRLQEGRTSSRLLMADYCRFLYERLGTFEEVARRADLDRRTVKKYLEMGDAPPFPKD